MKLLYLESLTNEPTSHNAGKKKAIVNARFVFGTVVTTGDVIEIGGNEKYKLILL